MVSDMEDDSDPGRECRVSWLDSRSTYSKNRDHLNIVTLPFHSGEKHTNSTG